jgi:hypothetical protein
LYYKNMLIIYLVGLTEMVITPLKTTELHNAPQRKREIIFIAEKFQTLQSQYSSGRSP